MDPADSGPGQEKPSEQSCSLPPSSKGRNRKKNSKYFDYETEEVSNAQNKSPRKSSGRRTASRKSGEAKKAAQEETVEPQECDVQLAEDTPKKAGRARKTPIKKTPAKKTPAKKTPAKKTSAKKTPAKKTPAKKTPAKKTPTKETPGTDGDIEAGAVVDGVQQENGTPKLKRRKKQQEEEPAAEPPAAPADPEPDEEPEQGGRRRRGAAKAALKYLHILAKEELNHPSDDSGSQPEANSEVSRAERESASQWKSKGRKGRKRKRPDSDSDAAEDEDFVPDVEENEAEEMEDEDDAEDSDFDLDFRTGGRSPASFHTNRTFSGPNFITPNGLSSSIMKTVWEATKTTKKFREEHYSSWVFPEWVPSSSDWHLVPPSDLEKYLPRTLQSAAFKVSRVGLSKEETPLQRLGRFESVSAHPDRWDMLLFAGGPVWAMEWCPTPDGAAASQYVALACHRAMDEQHYVNKTYTGPGLVQLWDVGKLEYNCRPDSQPVLAYGLVQEKGFIWNLKWCPAGGWEPPNCDRQAPLLPRLGLLAVGSSSGVVTIYSLPHPEALRSNKEPANSEKDSQQLPIYKAEAVLTLKLGSVKAPRHERSGQVLTMDWLPEKPHNIMAIGFYDGVVGLWDLSTKSALLRVREPDESLSLLPYRCFVAHDHAVRALAFCPASRYLLVTAGEDRYVKTWDLRRLYDPITALKRYLTNEIYWPLNACGLLLAQENAYTAKGSHGVHYFDHNMRTLFTVPRTGTLWSICYTDWLNSVVTSDSLGELILALLPQISYSPQYIKRTLDRRFPVYLTSLVPYDTSEEENQVTAGVEEEDEEQEEDATEELEGGETEGPDAASERGNENTNENGIGGRSRKENSPRLRFQKYKESVKKYFIHLTDNDMLTFAGNEKRAVWKHMKNTELKATINLDEMPLAAIHKVRFNPNMRCHTWVVSGGLTGLVRLNCLRSMNSSQAKKIIGENQARLNELFSTKDQTEAVQTVADEL